MVFFHRGVPALVLALLAALGSDARAATILVPGDFFTLQDALDAAAPDDTILVSGFQGQVTITKPITIIGSPSFSLETGCEFGGGSAIALAGPGSGKVVISGVGISSFDCFDPAAAISGAGFDELHLYDSNLSPSTGQTGVGDSNHTIAVGVPYLQIVNSIVKGAQPDSDSCSGSLPSGVYAAVSAPASTVVVLDSQITGGRAFVYCCNSCDCPSVLPSGGEGGHGIVADVAIVDGSVVTGGAGATYFADSGPCGSKPDGQAFIVNELYSLPDTTGSRTVGIGELWSYSFEVPGPQAFLFVSFGNPPPLLLPAKGWLFLDPPTFVFLATLPTGVPVTLDIPIANLPELIGTDLVFQIYDQTVGLTEPGFVLIGG